MDEQRLAHRLRRLPVVRVLGLDVRVAGDARARLLGLSGLDPETAGAGLLIPRCRSIHTFGMRFALDIVFLDGEGRPFSASLGVGARRLLWNRRASSVLELKSHHDLNLLDGDRDAIS